MWSSVSSCPGRRLCRACVPYAFVCLIYQRYARSAALRRGCSDCRYVVMGWFGVARLQQQRVEKLARFEKRRRLTITQSSPHPNTPTSNVLATSTIAKRPDGSGEYENVKLRSYYHVPWSSSSAASTKICVASLVEEDWLLASAIIHRDDSPNQNVVVATGVDVFCFALQADCIVRQHR